MPIQSDSRVLTSRQPVVFNPQPRPADFRPTRDATTRYWAFLRAIRQQITEQWQKLEGAPGRELSDVEDLGNNRFRMKYENGYIYKCGRKVAWVYGAIGDKYHALGGVNSWLGFPYTEAENIEQEPNFIAKEIDFDGGRVKGFENGYIYWWPDTGAIDLNNVTVHYTGLVCYGETTGWGPDEPYVIIGANPGVPYTEATVPTPIYSVEAGESRPDLMHLCTCLPLGLTLTILLMEHDEGDPDKYKEVVRTVVTNTAAAITTATAFIPIVGPAASAIVGPVLTALIPDITDFLNSALGTDDEQLARITMYIPPKQMVVLAARTVNSWEKGVGFKFQSPLLSGDGGSYKVYFGIVPA